MENQIHPTALIAEGAQIGKGVQIGPYSIIGPHVVLKENVKLHAHVVIEGQTTIGENTQIYPFVALGFAPQSAHYKGELTSIEIGQNCFIREHATIHPGTEKGGGKTTIGNNCYIMIGCHIGHDCHVGNFVTMANNATLGGHVIVEDYANIGGLAAIHQNVRIGTYAMISGTAGVNEDIMPFGIVRAMRGQLGGINVIGMRRNGFVKQDLHDVRNAYKLLARNQEGTLEERIEKIRRLYGHCRTVKELLEFIERDPKRHLCLPSEEWVFESDELEPEKRVANA